MSTTPDTIVLVHGFWVTPRSWEDWIARYEAKGFTVIAPAYPGYEVEVEALNVDPTPIVEQRVPAIIEHFESVISSLDQPPIIMGHSAGGAFTQILMDHGFGAAGVAINSAPTEGIRVVPPSQLKATFEVLKNPANHNRAVGFSFEQWNYAFTNGFPEERSRELYERYHIPASGRILWNSVLANFEPGHQDTWVDYHNDDRAPLLFISGSTDHLMPPKIQQSNLKHYKSNTITEIKEFEGPHLLPSQDGWEEVADFALDWALTHATATPRRRVNEPNVAPTVRLTHVGGPTVLVEFAGWRLLTDPTFDPPGRTYHFGLGTSSTKVEGPAIAAGEVGPLDAVLLTHDHHADNLDDTGRALLTDAAVVLTTESGADRLAGDLGDRVRGLAPWATTRLEHPGRPAITITATPCRHGPPLSRALVGDVIGFALSWEDQRHGVLWISGDTVLYDGVRQVADRFDVGVAILHLGAARFGVTGPVHYTMDAEHGLDLCRAVRPRTVVPVHYEGWSHFRQGRAGIEVALAAAEPELRDTILLLPIGKPADLPI